MFTVNSNDLLSPSAAANALGIKKETLSVWRCTKRYPLPFVKIGRKVFYRQKHIEDFIASRTEDFFV